MIAARACAVFGAAIGLVTIASTAPASPPPPPPDFIDGITQQLIQTPSADTFDRYAALLGNDLKVTANGKEVVAGKTGWLSIQRQQLGKIDRSVYGYAEGRNSILIMDRFDDRSDEHCPTGGTCVFDPRWQARAIRYSVGSDHLIHSIQILDSDGIVQSPRDR